MNVLRYWRLWTRLSERAAEMTLMHDDNDNKRSCNFEQNARELGSSNNPGPTLFLVRKGTCVIPDVYTAGPYSRYSERRDGAPEMTRMQHETLHASV
jgi:hypothetical protein